MRCWLLSLLVVSIFTLGVVAAHGDNHVKPGVLLENISIGPAADVPETISFTLSSSNIPKIFKIKGEKPRLVIDFFDTRYSAKINNVIKTDGHLIKSVRIGMHKDPPKTRVVVDLRQRGEYDYELNSGDKENVLTLTFYPGGSRAAASGKGAETPDTAVTPQALEKKAELGVAPEPADKAVGAVSADTGEPTTTVVDSTHPSTGKSAGNQTAKGGSVDAGGGDQVAVTKPGDNSLAAEERVNQIISDIKQPQPIPADPVLLDISFENTANDSEMVLFKLNDFYPPLVFGIEKGHPRVVCDFLDTDLADDVRPVLQTNGSFVSKIRTAEHPNPEKVRVVLDLVPNKNYDLQQVFFKEDNLFVIIISEFVKGTTPPSKTAPKSLGNQ